MMTIEDAALLFGISERVSYMEIRRRYHALLREWHPDVSLHPPEEAHEMAVRIKEAYDILSEYCMNYRISFEKEDISENMEYSHDTYWREHFGDDPIWG